MWLHPSFRILRGSHMSSSWCSLNLSIALWIGERIWLAILLYSAGRSLGLVGISCLSFFRQDGLWRCRRKTIDSSRYFLLAWETIQVHESPDDDDAVFKAVGQEVVHGGSKTIFAAVVPPEDVSDGGILRNRLSRGGAFRCFGSACHNCEMRLIGKE